MQNNLEGLPKSQKPEVEVVHRTIRFALDTERLEYRVSPLEIWNWIMASWPAVIPMANTWEIAPDGTRIQRRQGRY